MNVAFGAIAVKDVQVEEPEAILQATACDTGHDVTLAHSNEMAATQ